MEKKEFSNYFTSAITKEMLIDPHRDVTTIKVDLKLSTLKPLHLTTLNKIFNFFKTGDGEAIVKSVFQATGITKVIGKAREGNVLPLDPYI